MRRRAFIALAGSGLVLPRYAQGAPARYALDPAASRVTFTYRLLGNDAEGTMPVASADLTLDFQRVANSRAAVVLDARNARTGVGFVTDALKSPAVLDVARYPTIRFVGTRTVATETGARIAGNVTIRDVTRPLSLDAQIYRRQGSAEGDLSRLTVILTGAVQRGAFGAGGFPDLVTDTVGLNILARLIRQG